MRVSSLVLFILLCLMALVTSESSTHYEAPRYAAFCNFIVGLLPLS
jgi:hypothetical protein